MLLTNLKSLHDSMVAQSITNQQFRFSIRSISFDCLLAIGEYPFLLCLTARGNSPAFFRFEIDDKFLAPRYFDTDDYQALAALLRTDGRSGNRLYPTEFFAALDAATPGFATPHRVPSPVELMRLRSDVNEHRDRPFFDAWIYWKDTDRGPTEMNRQKTRALLGRAALEHSVKFKASSRWSAINLDRDWIVSKTS